MKAVNKLLKLIISFFLYLWVDIQLFVVSLGLVSPILMLLLSIDTIVYKTIPAIFCSKLWLIWIVCALPVTLFLSIKTWLNSKK